MISFFIAATILTTVLADPRQSPPDQGKLTNIFRHGNYEHANQRSAKGYLGSITGSTFKPTNHSSESSKPDFEADLEDVLNEEPPRPIMLREGSRFLQAQTQFKFDSPPVKQEPKAPEVEMDFELNLYQCSEGQRLRIIPDPKVCIMVVPYDVTQWM
ncbi:hypothetical protein DSO57_1030409 [Entomophthora muscae]|uniref:Uncharacterized protein n=1 Tax=Entomophthora muscae TaxID=34485 RepID=A0ACC2TNC6_9FUNG|nr:hypothetical protein DSO57_1030409 [Entomophthora muscae]